jgi:hypothetical protein
VLAQSDRLHLFGQQLTRLHGLYGSLLRPLEARAAARAPHPRTPHIAATARTRTREQDVRTRMGSVAASVDPFEDLNQFVAEQCVFARHAPRLHAPE